MTTQPASQGSEDEAAAWGKAARYEPRWPAALAVLAAVFLTATLKARYVYPQQWLLPIDPRWLLPALEATLLLPLLISGPIRSTHETHWQRYCSLALIAVINAANVYSLMRLIDDLLRGRINDGYVLLLTSAQIWLTNVIVFALWYWELDRGGPGKRCEPPVRRREPDFLFPQMANPESAPEDWHPSFMDYVYVAFTNATAFSPTDTMPMTEWAKALMMVQSLASLVTVALVAARAVNLLR